MSWEISQKHKSNAHTSLSLNHVKMSNRNRNTLSTSKALYRLFQFMFCFVNWVGSTSWTWISGSNPQNNYLFYQHPLNWLLLALICALEKHSLVLDQLTINYFSMITIWSLFYKCPSIDFKGKHWHFFLKNKITQFWHNRKHTQHVPLKEIPLWLVVSGRYQSIITGNNILQYSSVFPW